MAAKKRSKFQIENDRVVIARLYMQGKSQAEIAAVFNVTQQQIAYDLKHIRDEWRAARFADLNEMKAEQLAKIDEVEREAWAAWGRSQIPTEITDTKRIAGKEIKDTAGIRKISQYGDPRFLDKIQWCIEHRLKIFGLYAPTKLDVTKLDDLLDAELQKYIEVTKGEQSQSDYVN